MKGDRIDKFARIWIKVLIGLLVTIVAFFLGGLIYECIAARNPIMLLVFVPGALILSATWAVNVIERNEEEGSSASLRKTKPTVNQKTLPKRRK